MNIRKLKASLVEQDISVEQLADHMECHVTTMYRKLNNPETITIGEAIKIKDFVHLSDDDAVAIFLT